MTVEQAAWLVAIAVGSLIAKTFGLFLRKRDPGFFRGPLLGVAGAVLAWAFLSRIVGHDATDWNAAAACGAVGGSAFYFAGVVAKRRRLARLDAATGLR
jgi:uncharacterized membrane protein YeaQ/YmgE (transglycosylase-associated protein family)